MPERDIRKALKKRVEQHGGEIRAVSWLGRRNAPDVLCLFPKKVLVLALGGGVRYLDQHPFVETKAPDGEPTDAQLREHERMRDAGCVVLVISTNEQLDEWLPPL
jgi:hypothetical protein